MRIIKQIGLMVIVAFVMIGITHSATLNELPLGTSVTQISGTDQLSDLDTLINIVSLELNEGKMEVSTTSVDSITTLSNLTSAGAISSLPNLTTVGTITSGTWNSLFAAGLIDGDDINSNLAGDYLTKDSGSPDKINADVELYTYGIAANLVATTTVDGIATTTEDFIAVRVPVASTITGFNCYATETGTSTIKATVTSDPLSAGTDILYATGIDCGAEVYTATTTFSQTAVSAGDIIRFYVSDAEPTGSRPRTIYPNFELTKDD